jgi:hypothetical protein
MSDIIDDLDKDLSSSKLESSNKELEKEKICKNFKKLEELVYEKYFKKDFDKLEIVVKKHLSHQESKISIYNRFGKFEVERGDFILDDYETALVDIDVDYILEENYIPEAQSLDELKKKKFQENDFGLRISYKGDNDYSDPIAPMRPILEQKSYKLNEKDSAFKYFNELLKKHILLIKK